ncbi:arylsulfatase [Sphingomonas sp. DBB INV C78]|uniref:sulfatase-like hydrolase/transferase n=1 Tax=Sphingomonas sp. DBB INV C78 TaxID=3349434 RepID=UPI0036D2A5D3
MAVRRPNILLILADDLGYSDLGAFGGEIATPHLDALAMAGVRFTAFHSAPACSPTRAMLMTGTDPHIAGIGTMLEVARPGFQGAPGYEGHLNHRVVTVAELLQAAGWHTILSGKWHLGDTATSIPAARGFDRSFALMPAGASHYSGAEADAFSVVETAYQEDGVAVAELPADFYSSDYYTDRLIGYLGERPAGQPFFAYLPFTAPHWPIQAPAECIAKYRGRYDAGPEVLRAERLERQVAMGLCPADVIAHDFVGGEPWDTLSAEERAWSARAMEAYAGMVDRIDWNVGRIVDHLRETGELDNTLILFLSDNGAEGAMVEAMPIFGPIIADRVNRLFDNSIDNLGSPTSCFWYGPRWAQAATAPSRLHKSYTAEGGIRVPFFASGPGIAGRGRASGAFATAMDVAATILDVAGIAQPAEWEGRAIVPQRGRSLAPHLADEMGEVHPAGTETGWELFGRRAIRRDDWKALWLDPPEGPGRWQLYDLGADPGETTDLAENRADVLAEMMAAWDRYVVEVGVVTEPVSVFEMVRD